MKNTKTSYIVLWILTIGIFYLSYLTFNVFLSEFIWAAVVSTFCHPLYKRLNKLFKGKETLAALTACLSVTLLIIIPTVYFLFLLGKEAVQAFNLLDDFLQKGGANDLLDKAPYLKTMWVKTLKFLESHDIDITSNYLDSVKEWGKSILSGSLTALKNIASSIFSLFLLLFIMFYFFKDGKGFVEQIKKMLPLKEKQKELIFTRLKDMIYASILGNFITHLSQGFLGGLAFFILGIPSPIFWGVMMAFLTFLPFIGPWIIWGPAAFYLWMQGHSIKAVILLVWGLFAVGLVDNFLRPVLIGKKTGLSTLILFFAILGGVFQFGIVGVIVGPLIAAVFLITVEMYTETMEKKGNAEETEG